MLMRNGRHMECVHAMLVCFRRQVRHCMGKREVDPRRYRIAMMRCLIWGRWLVDRREKCFIWFVLFCFVSPDECLELSATEVYMHDA